MLAAVNGGAIEQMLSTALVGAFQLMADAEGVMTLHNRPEYLIQVLASGER